MIKFLPEKVNRFGLLAIFPETSVIDVWLGPKYASAAVQKLLTNSLEKQ